MSKKKKGSKIITTTTTKTTVVIVLVEEVKRGKLHCMDQKDPPTALSSFQHMIDQQSKTPKPKPKINTVLILSKSTFERNLSTM